MKDDTLTEDYTVTKQDVMVIYDKIENYRIVTWPESQMYMEHPQAKLLNSEEDLNKYGACAYRIPKNLITEQTIKQNPKIIKEII